MPVYTSTANTRGILPDDFGELVVQPFMAESVAATVSTIATTANNRYRIPVVTADASASFVAEGAEIPVSDPTLSELTVTPSKVAGLTIVSRELADDSDPAASDVVGQSLARDIARKVDQAFFSAMAAPAPSGLGAVSGVQAIVSASAFTNLDAFAEAISLSETVGAAPTSFVTNPATALSLARIKTATGSNEPVLGKDATSATSRQILGVPLFVSPSVAANTLWALDSSRVWLVLREDTTVEADRSAYFSSDRVGVRAIMRAGFAFTHPASIVKVTSA